jgi:peptidoglycan hydrolase-like protein with peptidoglycan-binding domain
MRGASGPDVLSLQRALAAAGIAIIADGVFGPETERAVKQFQAGHKLDPDGICGLRTWAVLGV